MKMTKKILLAAVAVAAVMFAGCKGSFSGLMQKEFGEEKLFTYDDSTYASGLGTWTINGVNNPKASSEDDPYIRGAKLLLTKHSDIAGLVNIESGAGAGNIGLVFDVTKNTVRDENGKNKELWNFCVIGVQMETATNARYYVSYFANISNEDMAKINFGAYDPVAKKNITKSAIDPTCTTPYEIDLTKLLKGSSFKNLPGVISDGNLSVVVDVKEDGKKGNNTGDYTIKFYKSDVLEKNNTLKVTDETPVIADITINGTLLGKTESAQAYVGAYGNIYPGMTMTGSLEILDLTHQALPVEE
ncbi:MAG: hypothetical protein MR958_05440 [Spirochaetia bacterium]|nr:hypothetical protein [Spirochaetia bacterium]MDD7269016.1 hypothetical protein [Treponema sp.]